MTHSKLTDHIWSGTMTAISPAIERDRYFRMQEQLEAFKTIAIVISSRQSNEVVMKTICQQITQIMRADRTMLYMVKRDGERVWLEATSGNKSTIRVEFGQGIVGWVAAKQRLLNLKDAHQDKRFDPDFDIKTNYHTTSCVCAPLFNRDHLIGVIVSSNKFNGYFTLEDEELLTYICTQISVSIAQYTTYLELDNKNIALLEAQNSLRIKNDELFQRNNELQLLYDIERDSTCATDLVAFFDRLETRCLQIFHADYAAIIHTDDSRIMFYEKRQIDSDASPLQIRYAESLHNFIKKCIECAGPVMFTHELLERETLYALGTSLNAILAVPLRHDEQTFGTLILGKTAAGATPFQPSDGRLSTLLSGHISSIIATKKAHEADEKKQRLTTIGQMMSSLLHDMKTPLANISGYAELMAAPSTAPEKRNAFLDVIDRQVETLRTMSAEILEFARGESTFCMKPTNLNNIIQQAVHLLETEAEKKSIKIITTSSYNDDLVCDEIKLQRVLVNLIKNAIEAYKTEGTIQVLVFFDAKYIYIRVEDDGPGIPEAIRRNLFDPFVTYGKKGGTGLGLAIVKNIMDHHHATISCTQVSPHGTAFTIAFNRN